ncbi:MAG TPA: hypothetical protein EYO33_09335 [Phycisphaerales bacterium]|nr:hypothetical protein [Phycisphaerales bacterium]
MGHRANYIVIENGRESLYYSHWGANVVERDLFWGPEESLRFIRTQRKTDDWLDEVWCEGGALLDLDRKFMKLFGGEDIKYDPYFWKAYMDLLAKSWTPWKVEWAYQGILDLARGAGVSDETVLASRTSPRFPAELRALVFNMEGKVSSGGVLEVDGAHYTLAYELSEILPLGLSLLKALPQKPPPLFLGPEPPATGAVISTTHKTIRLWDFTSKPMYLESLRAVWPGWRVELEPDLALTQCERFALLCGWSPPTAKETLQQLKAHLLHQVESRALTLESLRDIHGEEADIAVNPLAGEDIRPQPTVSHQDYLDRLLKELP